MTTSINPTIIKPDILPDLLQYCEDKAYIHFALIADRKTYKAFGEKIHQSLIELNYDVLLILLKSEEIAADEQSIAEIILQLDNLERVFLAVGSGTITDLTRFISHRMRMPFISLPTAPSMDGFAATGAALIHKGMKISVPCHPPAAIFADINTLCHAPQDLIAAGFGDLVGKYTSVADWKIGQLIWGEKFDLSLAARSLGIANSCQKMAGEVRKRSTAGIESLTQGLIQSSFCILEFGTSEPGSGGEHHFSHYWEMRMLREKRRAVYHGLKVGTATVLVAEYYDRIHKTGKTQLKTILDEAKLPDATTEVAKIQKHFGSAANNILKKQKMFLEMPPEQFERLKDNILHNWEQIQEIASEVPPPEEITDLLRKAKCPLNPEDIDISTEEILDAKQYCHFLRPRFTIHKMMYLLGMPT
ncbi:MAG: sn-glycerol-1-phosphate dehydrogenase [Anaerolineaceae bacterium]|nr:sn-glycerol-1-phosphate dehydrogenase [Anaerolineaceae bacterium]